ncbi:MAG TPA: RNA polymerase sigma factor RpoD/SigA [Chitinophagaceae bacterium]|nr:RNA polymerase sigma factor RpoD/SigA [Chitinophagaceae bacterium]
MSMRQLKISKSITNRESHSLEKYLQEVNKLKLISAEEEVKLAGLIKQGDKNAFDILVKANLRFVVSVAKQYQYQGISLSDLINEGNLGLMKAARSFDASRGFKFISYAVWWIRQFIVKAIADDARMVRLPLNKISLERNIKKASIMLEQKLERSASVEELAEELNMEAENISDSLSTGNKHFSLDAALTEDGENSMLDMLENPNAVSPDKEVNYMGSLKTEIDRSFQVLTERQKETLCYLYGIGVDRPLSLDDIGTKFDLTRERVRQIRDKAIGKLRNTGNINTLRSFLAA